MASIIVEQRIEAPAASCWNAVRDFAALNNVSHRGSLSILK